MIHQEEEGWLLRNVRASALPKAALLSLPTIFVSLLLSYMDKIDPDVRRDSGIDDVTESQLWNAMTAVIAIMLAFRTKQALGRFWEGTGLLHQMRGEWFDAASCLMAFSRDAKINKNKEKEVNEFRHTLMRLMSLMHGSALDEISGGDDDRYEVLDIHGLDQRTLRFLRDCKEKLGFNRVEALQHMIQVLVTHNHHSGIITIPPPILSRIYQTLSRGLVNLLNARKIKDTCFPIPYAQVIALLLCVHSLFTPLIMTQIISSPVFAAMLSFFPILGMTTLNVIAAELEMPFGSDANDLPLRHFQAEMNDALLMLIHDFADHLPCTSRSAKFSYETLQCFTRASVLKREKIAAASDSQAFMRKDFFWFEGQSLAQTLTLEGEQLETKKREPEVEAPKEPPRPLVPEVRVTPKVTPRSAAPGGNTALLSVPESTLISEPAVQTAATIVTAEPVLPVLTNFLDVSVRQPTEESDFRPSPRANSSTLLCCAARSSTPREFVVPMVANEGTGSKRQYMPTEQVHTLVQLTELQVNELKCNTESLRAFNKSYPAALNQHSEAIQLLTESICRTMQDAMASIGPRSEKSYMSSQV